MLSGKTKQAYLLIFLVLLCVLSASRGTTERLRGTTAAILAPSWQHLTSLMMSMKSPFASAASEQYPTKNGLALSTSEEILRLQLENRMLRNEIAELQEILQRERFLGSYDVERDELTGHRHELQQLMQMQMEAIPARVIYRARVSWNSFLWINVGAADNEVLGRNAIAKDSPVVIGTSIVGVVDYVGKKQSRVRLITDAELTPSVRSVRGSMQNRMIVQQIDGLLEKISKRPDLFTETDDKQFIEKMIGYKELLSKDKNSWFLAKGELQGSSKPLWRKQSLVLHGIGFNYDFPDEEGPARELRSGKPIGVANGPALPILKVNDLLITSGMDGVFPPGLQVAEVTSISPLREGDYYYELEAKPTAGNLDELSVVFVMPPVGKRESR